VRLDVNVDAYVPADYIPYEQAKIDVHRRIAAAYDVAELMALHYDPHYEKSQELHFRAWGRRRSVGAVDLSDQGIGAVAEAVLRLG